jgi:rhodanese-related sulfurtransferase
MKQVQILTALAFMLMYFPFLQSASAQNNHIEQISPVRAKLMARNGAQMIDVRTNEEIAALAYDVEGIMTIPLNELEDRMDEIPKDQQIILACASGNRSQKAAVLLRNGGYEQVANLEGGIEAWQGKDLEVIIEGNSTKKACCTNPKSKDCKPDGTCKPGSKSDKKACCSDVKMTK